MSGLCDCARCGGSHLNAYGACPKDTVPRPPGPPDPPHRPWDGLHSCPTCKSRCRFLTLAKAAKHPPFEFPIATFIPKHAAACKDQNCDRSCMKTEGS